MRERVAIVGSRAHPCLDIVADCVSLLAPGTVVVSGGALGVDSFAVERARARGLSTIEYLPHGVLVAGERRCIVRTRVDGGRYDGVHDAPRPIELPHTTNVRDALLFRNTLIALSDRVVVFPDGSRGGCWDAAREALRFRRPVEIWRYEPTSTPRHRIEPYRGGRR